MKYRSRTEIVCEILETAKGINGVTKTKIMYSAFLSFAQLKEYLATMLEGGVLEYMADRNVYRTTKKGIAMLESCQAVNKMLGVEANQ